MTAKSTLTNLIKRSFVEMMKDIGTAIPGEVLAFEPSEQLAQIQIGIQGVKLDGTTFTPAPLIEVPVYFPGGQFFIEYEINPGDEGLIIFSQRCVDAWKDSGGVAVNPILRFHDFSDAFFLPGVRSQLKRIPNFQNNGIRMSNQDGTNYLWLKNDGTAEIKVNTLNIDGDVVATGEVTGNGVALSTHTHGPGTYQAGGDPVINNSGTPS